MSSRVYRKLHGKDDLQAIHKDLMEKEDEESEDHDDDVISSSSTTAIVKPKKNLYALALVSVSITTSGEVKLSPF